MGPEVHQDLIFHAAGSVGGQADSFVRVEACDRLDQPHRADGDQILLVHVLRIVLFHDVGNQPQIALNEDIPGLPIPGPGAKQILPLLSGPQGLWERAGMIQAQSIQHRAQHQPCRNG